MARTEYVTHLRQDTAYALRLLRRAPGFAVVAIATLTFGIGGITAIFTIVESVLLRPLRFAESQRLTFVRTTAGSRVSPAYLNEWRLESRAFQDMAGWLDVSVILTGAGEPLEVVADRVTSNFFTVLGAPAFLGRTFTSERTLSRVEPEVVLSHGLWQRRFGGAPDIIGRQITVDGKSLTVVGVMPDGFAVRTVELSESRADLWMPLRLVPGDPVGMGGFLNVVGRLAGNATAGQAQTELTLIARRIEREHPSYSRDWGVLVTPLHEATVKDVRLALLVLFGALGIVLLIACTNVASLVLSRIASRRTELATRLALGATTGRLVRQFLTESLVLAAVSGTLGTLLAAWGTALLVSALPAGLDLPRAREIQVDLEIVAFGLFVTVLTAVLSGVVPSINSARSALRDAARGASAFRSGNSLGSTLIVSQVVLSVILLAGAGLLGRSFWKLTRVDPGFQAQHVLTMRMTLPAARYPNDDVIRVFSRELLGRIANLPTVRAVGFADYLPMAGVGVGGPFDIEGRPAPRAGDQPGSWISVVGGDYFGAMGIPLLRGRLPADADTESTQPIFIIDETLARRHWPGGDAIGRTVTWRREDGTRLTGTIIGVAGSVHWNGMAANPPATTYWWFPQAPGRQLTIVVRTSGDPVAMAGAITAQVREIDPDQPVAEIRAMRDIVSENLAKPRFTMLLLASFATVAVLLTAIGLYGLIAFTVAQRTREIGVRVALGAQHRDVLRLVMRRGLLLVGTGLAIGVAAALGLCRILTGLLYGVNPADPMTLVAVAAFVAAVAILATYLPARRAARVDPMVALRAE